MEHQFLVYWASPYEIPTLIDSKKNFYYGAFLSIVRGKGMASLILSKPQIQDTTLSTPKP